MRLEGYDDFSKQFAFSCQTLTLNSAEQPGLDAESSMGHVTNLPCVNWNSTGRTLKTPEIAKAQSDAQTTVVASYEMSFSRDFVTSGQVRFKFKAGFRLIRGDIPSSLF
jgi:hypothetical protein